MGGGCNPVGGDSMEIMGKSKKGITAGNYEHLSSAHLIVYVWNFSSYHYYGSSLSQIKKPSSYFGEPGTTITC